MVEQRAAVIPQVEVINWKMLFELSLLNYTEKVFSFTTLENSWDDVILN